MRIVVCGAGTAGCVVAARLSEDPATEVTLLEVGPPLPPRRLAGRALPLAPDHQGDPRLGLPGSRRGLAADGPRAARAGGGRLVGHQRRHRPARAPRALRRVGRAGRRLRLGDLAALVPRGRGRPRLRRGPLARRRRAHPDRPLSAPLDGAAGALLRGGPGRRPRVDRRPQRARGARDRADPAQHGRRRAPDPGRPLPRPGARAREPGAARRGAGRPGAWSRVAGSPGWTWSVPRAPRRSRPTRW